MTLPALAEPYSSINSLTLVRDPARLAALRRTALLDTPAEAAFDRLTRLAAALLHAPIALVTLVDEDRQFFKSCVGLPDELAAERGTPLSHAMCQHTVALAAPLVVEDTRVHPLMYDNGAVVELGAGAYAGMPLTTTDGYTIGSLCVIDMQPHVWSAEEIAILQDLAAAVMTEIELRITAQAARDALHARDSLLSMMSHDLKNPLMAVKGYTDLLRRRGRRADILNVAGLGDGLDKIEAAANKMTLLLDELMDVARLHSGDLPALNQQPTDVVALVQNVAAELKHTTTRHSIQIDITVSELIGSYDRVQIERALGNLLLNAIKYSPAGGPIIIKLTHEADAEQQWAVVAISDQGIGIPAGDLGRIFEQFQRGSNVVGQIAGTGLGLASAYQIVMQHNGTLTVESTEGVGSTFTLRLPLPR